MKYSKIILFAFSMLPLLIVSQEKVKDTTAVKLERAAFESAWIIDNPTNVLYGKNTMEIQMAHRFGLINGGTADLAGIWANSNIRIGVSYAIHDRLTLGFGTSKFNVMQDFNWKAALLRQTRGNEMPVSVSYYGNFAIDASNKQFATDQARYSYFHQLIIAKRFSPNFSMQIAPSISHYNAVEPRVRNDMFGLALSGRYKVSPQTSILVDISLPFTHHLFPDDADSPIKGFDPEPGYGLGVEFRTSSHAFQLTFSNYQGIVPQSNYMYNQNDFFYGDFLIGFNITRLYNF
jgi:hypothetical protein